MTSLHRRMQSFYSRQQRSRFESRFHIVWALVVGALFWLWGSTPLGHRIDLFVLMFALFGALYAGVALWAAWRVRRVVHRLRSLAPGDRNQPVRSEAEYGHGRLAGRRRRGAAKIGFAR